MRPAKSTTRQPQPLRAADLAASVAYRRDEITLDQVKHAHSPAMHAALARKLSAGNNPTSADAEIRWAIDHAAPAVCALVRRTPARTPGGCRQDSHFYQLDAGLR